jgi:hypothetical protein
MRISKYLPRLGVLGAFVLVILLLFVHFGTLSTQKEMLVLLKVLSLGLVLIGMGLCFSKKTDVSPIVFLLFALFMAFVVLEKGLQIDFRDPRGFDFGRHHPTNIIKRYYGNSEILYIASFSVLIITGAAFLVAFKRKQLFSSKWIILGTFILCLDHIAQPILLWNFFYQLNSEKLRENSAREEFRFRGKEDEIIPALRFGHMEDKAKVAKFLLKRRRYERKFIDEIIRARRETLADPYKRGGVYSEFFKFSSRYLGKSGNSGVISELKESLRDEDWVVQACAASGLGSLGEIAKPSIPALVPLLDNDLDAVRDSVIEAIFDIDPSPKKFLPKLTEMMLKDPEWDIRALICEHLGKMGKEARDAIPALEELLKDQKVPQKTVKEALRKIR